MNIDPECSSERSRRISLLDAIEILDSRGNPTIKTFVLLENGEVGTASVPSGKSKGTHEAKELRDGKLRYQGQGVHTAIGHIQTTFTKLLKGMDIEKLKDIDIRMIEHDGTDDKHRYGANTLLSISLACGRALAHCMKRPLWNVLHEQYFPLVTPSFPRLMVNIINGGVHASWNFDIQEFMIVPQYSSPSKLCEISAAIFHHLGGVFRQKNLSTLVGDEGGYSPSLASSEEALTYITQAINDVRAIDLYKNQQIDIALDSAASELYRDGNYIFRKSGHTLSTDQLLSYYISLVEQFPIISLEDPFFEDDWDGFINLTKRLKNTVHVVGDDLYTTNLSRIQKGIELCATDTVLIKPNQIGTLSETVAAIHLSKKHGLHTVISHRSGETEDSYIADLAVASAADFIKTGSMSRSERLAKYNRLIEIEARELL